MYSSPEAGARVCRAPEGRKAVDQLHRQYMEALRQLWDVHKGRFAIDRKRTLQIIDELPIPVAPKLPTGVDQEDSSGSSSASGGESGPDS
jgi:Diacylglycerol acyltransferase